MKLISLNRVAVCTLAFSALFSASVFASNLGVITGSEVNIRSDSSTNSSIIRQGNSNEVFTVTAAKNSFYEIKGSDISDGYVSFDFFKIISADAQVAGDGVNVRKEPSTSGEIITKLNLGTPITIIGQTGDWYAFTYNGSTAYINKAYALGTFIGKVPPVSEMLTSVPTTSAQTQTTTVKETTTETTTETVTELQKNNSEETTEETTEKAVAANTSAATLGEQIVAYAKQFVGTPYVYGGTDLNSGVDCSGFTSSIYKQFGITINRVSRDQISNGMPVSKSNLQPGDLIFFNTGGNSSISHVGMYIGNGQYIHSTDTNGLGVSIADLDSSYAQNTYYGACRVLA